MFGSIDLLDGSSTKTPKRSHSGVGSFQLTTTLPFIINSHTQRVTRLRFFPFLSPWKPVTFYFLPSF
ncbi:hypothetical protein JHK85_042862 [Glycine max]|uniref:Uncharacterized protein n=1 Tax=Glycine max TaxID=3847 RepID=K7MB48_SOYBN|nr:hypothetical protein JHK85_042862 [Glycine max]KAH1146976.1 hypothetical protein GYH30_042237 [Glycine max]